MVLEGNITVVQAMACGDGEGNITAGQAMRVGEEGGECAVLAEVRSWDVIHHNLYTCLAPLTEGSSNVQWQCV